MQLHDINTVIAELTSLYDNLNKRWQNDTCVSDLYQSYRQSEYHEVYEKLKEYNIESLILGIIANSLDEKILIRLRSLLYDNIQIYKTRQADFSNIDFSKAYSLQIVNTFYPEKTRRLEHSLRIVIPLRLVRILKRKED